MEHSAAERKIRALQKAVLCWAEEHPVLSRLDPNSFNGLRRRLFRMTFEAYRLGVVGPTDQDSDAAILALFYSPVPMPALDGAATLELNMKCFRVALEAFRHGAMVDRA